MLAPRKLIGGGGVDTITIPMDKFERLAAMPSSALWSLERDEGQTDFRLMGDSTLHHFRAAFTGNTPSSGRFPGEARVGNHHQEEGVGLDRQGLIALVFNGISQRLPS